MDVEAIKKLVQSGQFILSAHADQEAADEAIDIAEIRDALLDGEILEEYADTGRGESCLILGFANGKPVSRGLRVALQAGCDYHRLHPQAPKLC